MSRRRRNKSQNDQDEREYDEIEQQLNRMRPSFRPTNPNIKFNIPNEMISQNQQRKRSKSSSSRNNKQSEMIAETEYKIKIRDPILKKTTQNCPIQIVKRVPYKKQEQTTKQQQKQWNPIIEFNPTTPFPVPQPSPSPQLQPPPPPRPLKPHPPPPRPPTAQQDLQRRLQRLSITEQDKKIPQEFLRNLQLIMHPEVRPVYVTTLPSLERALTLYDTQEFNVNYYIDIYSISPLQKRQHLHLRQKCLPLAINDPLVNEKILEEVERMLGGIVVGVGLLWDYGGGGVEVRGDCYVEDPLNQNWSWDRSEVYKESFSTKQNNICNILQKQESISMIEEQNNDESEEDEDQGEQSDEQDQFDEINMTNFQKNQYLQRYPRTKKEKKQPVDDGQKLIIHGLRLWSPNFFVFWHSPVIISLKHLKRVTIGENSIKFVEGIKRNMTIVITVMTQTSWRNIQTSFNLIAKELLKASFYSMMIQNLTK